MEWLNRSTKQYVPTASPTTMASRYGGVFVDANGLAVGNAAWILSPDMSAVAGLPSKYWVITGDVITLMDQNEQDVVDAAAEEARLDSIANELDQTQTIMKAFAEVMLDQLNTLRAEHSLPTATLAQLKAAVRGKL